VTGSARILVVVGIVVLGVAVMVLWRDERTVPSVKPTASPAEQRVGRSTVSHGGPATDSLPDAPQRPSLPDRNVPSNSPHPTTPQRGNE
jgi:hypothetical protein